MIDATDKRTPPKGSETHGGRVSPPPLRLTRERKGLAVWSEDRHLLTFSTDPRYRTHIHPLNAPGTECPMTRFRPVDHPWQYGVFVGLNKVNGLDFWCSGDAVYDPAIRGIMRLREVVNMETTSKGIGFTAVNDWIGPSGGAVLEEHQRLWIPVQTTDVQYVVDWEWTLIARDDDVEVGASAYGGLSVRLVGRGETRRHLNSEHQTGDQCAEAAARWCCVAQPVDGVGTYTRETAAMFAYAGVAVFDHPSNPGFPNRWRVDGDGMINPCRALSGPWSIPRGTRTTSRYRLFVFLGVPDYTAIDAAYRQWMAWS
jgi:hypothetical protein